MTFRFVIYFLFISAFLMGQDERLENHEELGLYNIGDCIGAIQIETNVSSNVQFQGHGGDVDEFSKHQQIISEEKNSLWFACRSDIPGNLSITLEGVDFPFQYSAYLLTENYDCQSIVDGTLKPIYQGRNNGESLLNFLMDSVQLDSDHELVLCVNSEQKEKSSFQVITSFSQEISAEEIESMKKKYDFRENRTEEAFYVEIRDAETKLPVVAKVILTETKSNNALYMVSDFVFPYKEQLKMNLKIDLEGYYFKDEEISLRQLDTNTVVIYLLPIHSNQSIELEGLEFVSQSDVLLPVAYSKLRRLKDFMVLNPKVEIEIQGHVHLLGKNTFRAKILSRKRAQKVRSYLVDSGVDKSRMTIKGFGNSQMLYPKAESIPQVQANRRVEIRITNKN
ncbi:OmpA family protein [Brumimicrobium aurantiacum]|uniref:OmpA family protein n=1 Tax=Brumimicrobium aurantiacum TaxID=1737063 RepID=A0A3E1EX55_9FLAO|nr:OmpA family protein [Brumimicrobium aurantiacum]RFC54136.1 OmpA family protein [Brumimicrobium aurantiacum]